MHLWFLHVVLAIYMTTMESTRLCELQNELETIKSGCNYFPCPTLYSVQSSIENKWRLNKKQSHSGSISNVEPMTAANGLRKQGGADWMPKTDHGIRGSNSQSCSFPALGDKGRERTTFRRSTCGVKPRETS